MRSLFLLCAFAVMLYADAPLYGDAPETLSADEVNLALRRTADQLLRVSGDSTSRIPAIEQTGELTWRIDLNGPIRYDTLPALIEASLTQYGITMPYQVSLRRCADDLIDLGFHQRDFQQDGIVACMARESPEGCHYLEVTFTNQDGGSKIHPVTASVLLILLFSGAGLIWWTRKQKEEPEADGNTSDEWLSFGRSRLDFTRQVVECAGKRESLTYREAKLLRLFASSPGTLLEREEILRQVWEDEGVQVGRSVDMFVSRLRKKLKADPTVSIVAVHGMGYRMVVQDA